jgi:hypothetical protein
LSCRFVAIASKMVSQNKWAGVAQTIKAVSELMGPSDTAITLDRYGHLLPGAGDEAAELLDEYLAQWPLSVLTTHGGRGRIPHRQAGFGSTRGLRQRP